MCDVSKIIDDAEKLADTTEKSVGVIEKILNKFPLYRANTLFIEEIEKSDLPPAEKMALLYNHKAIKKQIKNQASIYDMSNTILIEKGKTLEAEVDSLDEDWFAYFNDIVKNVSDEEMQIIWAKILAGECENHGSVGKRLMSILQVISKDEAEVFSYMCSHSFIVKLNEEDNDFFDCMFIWPERVLSTEENLYKYYDKTKINDFSIMNLSGIGLLDYSSMGFMLNGEDVIIDGFDGTYKIHAVNSDGGISAGLVSFTTPGIQLIQILRKNLDIKNNPYYVELVKKYYTDKGYKFVSL